MSNATFRTSQRLRRPRKTTATTKPRRTRLAPEARRQALIQVAGGLLTRHGVDRVQFADVAAAAGVTRQLVYNVFPNRQALIVGVLEDFAAELARRFSDGAKRRAPDDLAGATRIFVEAVCDTIDAKGVGAWQLLDAKGPQPEVARAGAALQDRVVAPWLAPIAERLGTSEHEAATVARMIVAAGRAVLELWHVGALTREEAVRDTTRGVSALLQAFSAPAKRRRPR